MSSIGNGGEEILSARKEFSSPAPISLKREAEEIDSSAPQTAEQLQANLSGAQYMGASENQGHRALHKSGEAGESPGYSEGSNPNGKVAKPPEQELKKVQTRPPLPERPSTKANVPPQTESLGKSDVEGMGPQLLELKKQHGLNLRSKLKLQESEAVEKGAMTGKAAEEAFDDPNKSANQVPIATIPYKVKRNARQDSLQLGDVTLQNKHKVSQSSIPALGQSTEPRIASAPFGGGASFRPKTWGGHETPVKRLLRRSTNMRAPDEFDAISNGDGIPLYELVKGSRRINAERRCLEGLLFLLFTVLFGVLVVWTRKTSYAAETTETVLDLFVNEEFKALDVQSLADEDVFFYKSYSDIRTREEWWQWAFGPLLDGLFYGEVSFEEESMTRLTLLKNLSQLYVLGGETGGIVIRTARVKPTPCGVIDRMCYGAWDESNDVVSKENFLNPDVSIDPLFEKAFEYRESGLGSEFRGTLLGEFIWGLNDFGPNGFYLDLPANNAGNLTVRAFESLFGADYIDEATRVIAVEFNVFSPVTKVVTAARLFTEISQTGLVRPSFRFYHLNALMFSDFGGLWFFVAVFFALLVVFTINWFYQCLCAHNFVRHISRWVVIFDALILFLFWLSVCRIMLLTLTCPVLLEEQFYETYERGGFTNNVFECARSYHNVDATCSITLMVATVKLVGFMPFKTTRTIWSTLEGATKDILVLGSVVLMFWAGFAIGSHLTFGSLGLSEFNRIDRTFGTLMVLMFSGSVDFNAMRDISFYSAPFFYALYMIFMWGVMLNLFVAIIVLTYERHTDVQQNFENWVNQHHGVDWGCIVLTYPEIFAHKIRTVFFKARVAMFYRSDVQKLANSPRIRKNRPKGQEELSQLRNLMQIIKCARDPAERAAASEQLGYPYRKYLQRVVREMMWRRALRRTKIVLKYLMDDDEQADSFLSKWREEFTFAKGTSHTAIQLHTLLMSWFWPSLLSRQQQAPARQDSFLTLAGSMQSHALRSGTNSDGSFQSFQFRANSHRILKLVRLQKIQRKEEQLIKHKKIIQGVIESTRKNFFKHRIDFDGILRFAWRKTKSEEERLRNLDLGDLEEMFSPGCSNTECPHCKNIDVTELAKQLLLNYSELKKSREFYQNNVYHVRPRSSRSRKLSFGDQHSEGVP